jgi:geranylgeranyl diphosphate synthase type II
MLAETAVADVRKAFEERLADQISMPKSVPLNLQGALRHALLAPSKRLRPLAVYLVSDPAGPMRRAALDAGCAVEMVHTASLILDDLPCMDNALTRRQRPTTHIAFGESTAILSAIALLNRAFGILADIDAISDARRTELARILSQAVGWEGLVTGQEIDINERSRLSGTHEVEELNWLKTGVLFVAAAEMGAVLRGLEGERREAIRRFATHLGIAFQTADDLIDARASSADAGKDTRKDGSKPTLVTLLGVEQARLSCEEHLASADAALVDSGIDPTALRALMQSLFKIKT